MLCTGSTFEHILLNSSGCPPGLRIPVTKGQEQMQFCSLLLHAMRAAFLLPPAYSPWLTFSFGGQLGGTSWIHIRDLANNLADWKTELWFPRMCPWPFSVAGDGALTGSLTDLNALRISEKYVAEYLQTYLRLGHLLFPAATWSHAEMSPTWGFFPLSLNMFFSQKRRWASASETKSSVLQQVQIPRTWTGTGHSHNVS